jgi:glycosyltransferase involved in cell wall biosynthesis
MAGPKILFVQWRFHPNQHAFVAALVDAGATVRFIARHIGPGEDHSQVQPVVLGRSWISELLVRVGGPLHFGFPPVRPLIGAMRSFEPDTVVVRGYGLGSLLPMVIAAVQGARVVMQEQKSWDRPDGVLIRCINWGFATVLRRPIIRVSPIAPEDDPATHRYRIPFVCESAPAPVQRRDGPLQILHVGKLGQPRKNHLQLLDVLERVLVDADVELRFVGGLTEATPHTRALLEAIADRGLTERVAVVANVPHARMRTLYREADVFVLNSHDEPAAFSFLEAMSVGTPVIVTADNGTTRYITDGEDGLVVDPADPASLEAALRRLLEDAEDRRALGEAGRRTIADEHDPDHWARRFLAIVEEASLRG